MYLSRKKLPKSFGLATAAMLLVGASSAFAGPVTAVQHFGPTDYGYLDKTCFVLDYPALLIWSGYARALANKDKESSALIKLVIVKVKECQRDVRIEEVIEKDTCAVDRMLVQDIGDFNLYESATCVRQLEPGTYRLRAYHETKSAQRKNLSMDVALVQIP